MDIIVVSQDRTRTRTLSLGAGNWKLWTPIILLVLVCSVLATMLGQRFGQLQSPPTGYISSETAVELSNLWAVQVEEQQGELKLLKKQAQENANALSRRVAQLQARMLRLDAAGARMTEVAGLDPEEFAFSELPPVGGPEAQGAASEPSEMDPVLTSIRSMEEKLAGRERQMQVLEDILLAGRLHREQKPSGLPISNGYLSSHYGWRADPFTGRRTLHQGVDFAAPAGSDVLSVASGIVSEAGKRDGYGQIVEINHGGGYVTRYAHNRSVLVSAGQKVEKGQKIATVGSSGRSTGPHVHFEVLLNGYVVNPAQYIRAAAK